MTTKPPHLLFVEAQFYPHISALLHAGAERAAQAAGATFEAVPVPGSFELPGAIALAAAHAPGRFDGYVALGCVIRGETSHYDHVCTEAARGLQQLALSGLAVGFGIATCENEAQALARTSPEGRDMGGKAVQACLAMVAVKRRFAGSGG
jgi:6,7-dimethyl-8-ribityllumazine synthase